MIETDRDRKSHQRERLSQSKTIKEADRDRKSFGRDRQGQKERPMKKTDIDTETDIAETDRDKRAT